LRVVTDVVEGDDAEVRDSLAGVVGDVGAGSWIGHAPHQLERHIGSLECALPPGEVRSPLAHIPEQFGCDRHSASVSDELPVFMQLCRGRLMFAREDR